MVLFLPMLRIRIRDPVLFSPSGFGMSFPFFDEIFLHYLQNSCYFSLWTRLLLKLTISNKAKVCFLLLPLFYRGCRIWDLGSGTEIWDRDPGWKNSHIQIRDKTSWIRDKKNIQNPQHCFQKSTDILIVLSREPKGLFPLLTYQLVEWSKVLFDMAKSEGAWVL
jgi:hypothetical protein